MYSLEDLPRVTHLNDAEVRYDIAFNIVYVFGEHKPFIHWTLIAWWVASEAYCRHSEAGYGRPGASSSFLALDLTAMHLPWQ